MARAPFERIVTEHGPTVLRVCRALLRPEDAQDAWAETFLSALRAYPQLPVEANVAAWLTTIAHRKAIRTTNLLERLFGEERRRTKTIPHAFGERAVLKLMFAALARASQTWRRLVISEFELKQIEELQTELQTKFRQRTTAAAPTASRLHFSSNNKT